MIEEAKNFQ